MRNLNCRFATQYEDGLLLYNGRYNEQHDFIALEIISGMIQFTFSLGAENSSTSVYVPDINDGKWHTVNIEYFNKVYSFLRTQHKIWYKYEQHLLILVLLIMSIYAYDYFRNYVLENIQGLKS